MDTHSKRSARRSRSRQILSGGLAVIAGLESVANTLESEFGNLPDSGTYATTEPFPGELKYSSVAETGSRSSALRKQEWCNLGRLTSRFLWRRCYINGAAARSLPTKRNSY